MVAGNEKLNAGFPFIIWKIKFKDFPNDLYQVNSEGRFYYGSR